MKKLEIGDWVFLPDGGSGKVFGFEDGLVVVEVDYTCLVRFLPEEVRSRAQNPC